MLKLQDRYGLKGSVNSVTGSFFHTEPCMYIALIGRTLKCLQHGTRTSGLS